ncbi:MAG: SDR family NAD(P)-dependent oxidoreductase [Hyphomonadaceae bacterium]|nr:SDR family NAD(P)-dependent oxidoreductase [Hyphomonadaceae bacterium]
MAKRWFITGCSTGLGRALAEHALERGDRVAVTARRVESVSDIVAKAPDRAIAIALDVTKPAEVRAAAQKAFDTLGGVDVLVNNAGFGIQATTEDAEDTQIRALFETNVFGLLDVIRVFLPRLRAQGGGHIINISSVGGRTSAPMVGLYSATKYAVEGLSKGLAGEVASQGIRLTVIEPGAYATRFPDNLAKATASAPYAEAARLTDEFLATAVFEDPRLAASVIAKVADMPEPPAQLLLGRVAHGMIEADLAAQQAELARWRDLSYEAAAPIK